MRKLCGLLPLMGLFFGFSATTQAAEVTRVASSFDGENKFDLHFGVGYDFNFKKAALLREWSDANNPSSTVVRDLLYQQFRHVVTPSMEIGLYKDLAVYVNLPVVVADQRSPRDGRVIETVGRYNAQTDPSTIVIDEERVKVWLAKGAQPTETVRKLLKTQGIDPNG